jgi:hypothetical protein
MRRACPGGSTGTSRAPLRRTRGGRCAPRGSLLWITWTSPRTRHAAKEQLTRIEQTEKTVSHVSGLYCQACTRLHRAGQRRRRPPHPPRRFASGPLPLPPQAGGEGKFAQRYGFSSINAFAVADAGSSPSGYSAEESRLVRSASDSKTP